MLLHFLLKIVNVKTCPLRSKGAPWLKQVSTNTGIKKWGLYVKIISREEFWHCSTILENIIVYIAFVATIYPLYFFNNIRISKNVRPCPLPPTYNYTHCKQRNLSLATQNVSTFQHTHTHTHNIYICYCPHFLLLPPLWLGGTYKYKLV